jgi:hypothetical protein
MCFSKGADSLEQAVNQFYEDPEKYSRPNISSSKEGSKTKVFSPSHAQPVKTVVGQRHRHHTNAVIEAGHIRARDEVRFTTHLM